MPSVPVHHVPARHLDDEALPDLAQVSDLSQESEARTIASEDSLETFRGPQSAKSEAGTVETFLGAASEAGLDTPNTIGTDLDAGFHRDSLNTDGGQQQGLRNCFNFLVLYDMGETTKIEKL